MFSIKLKLMVFFHGLEISLELKLFIVCKLNQNSACWGCFWRLKCRPDHFLQILQGSLCCHWPESCEKRMLESLNHLEMQFVHCRHQLLYWQDPETSWCSQHCFHPWRHALLFQPEIQGGAMLRGIPRKLKGTISATPFFLFTSRDTCNN